MLLFPDYKKMVFQDYQEKKTARKLPLELMEGSPAKIRDACWLVCEDRYTRKDEWVLRAFFGNAEDKKARLQSIRNVKVGKLKPLANYLKEPTIDTDFKNVELLAWLIDYQERPYPYGPPIQGPIPGEENPAVEPDTPEDPVQTEPPGETPEPASNGSKIKKITIIITITVALAGVGIFYGLQSIQPARTFPPIPPGTQACMFWADDHYQPVSCNQKLGDTVVIALDSEKLAHFRKITRPDTITDAAIGHVWYVRYRGAYEFYTSGGYHPLDPNLRLRPITSFIIRQHIPVNK
jgi:hypothetical protein